MMSFAVSPTSRFKTHLAGIKPVHILMDRICVHPSITVVNIMISIEQFRILKSIKNHFAVLIPIFCTNYD